MLARLAPPILLATLLGLGAFDASAADKTRWPWPCAPAAVTGGAAIQPDVIVGLTLGLPKTVEVPGGGYSWVWGCRGTSAVLPQETHATYDWVAAHTDIKAMLEGRNPMDVFWSNATTSSCFDPKGYWPTMQERVLCAGVRKAWTDWALK